MGLSKNGSQSRSPIFWIDQLDLPHLDHSSLIIPSHLATNTHVQQPSNTWSVPKTSAQMAKEISLSRPCFHMFPWFPGPAPPSLQPIALPSVFPLARFEPAEDHSANPAGGTLERQGEWRLDIPSGNLT